MRAWVVAFAVVMLAGPVVAADQVMSPAEKAAVDRAVDRGKQIYRLDQAAWHASDELQEQARSRQLPAKVRGWVVIPHGDEDSVIFYGIDQDKPVPVADVETRTGKVLLTTIVGGDHPMPLSPIALRMIQARETAATGKFNRCVQSPFNTVVLPPSNATDPVEVYLLTPQLKAEQYPFGGNYLAVIDTKGQIASSRPFTNSCIVLGAQPGPTDKTVGLFITHFLDPTPTEIHVFLSLESKTPVFVSTSDRQVWEVDGEHVRKAAMTQAK